MAKTLVLILVVTFFIGGCTNVDVYTFKKDRVDQGTGDNRGFAKEDPGQTPVKKRTLIGIDIGVETYNSLDEDENAQPSMPEKTEPSKIKPAQPATNVEPKNVSKTEVVEVVEEEWIK